MDFREIFPDDKQYQSAVRLYLQDANVKEREARLGVFSVHDIGFVAKPLGYLVLDLEERDGKPRGALCRTFANVCACSSVAEPATLRTNFKSSIHMSTVWGKR
jgi:hypothetical protein